MKSLRIATFLAPSVEPVYRYIAEEVGRRVGLAVEFSVGRDFAQFAAGEVDAGFI